MIKSILGILKAGLSIWEHKEANKYLDRLLKLEKEFYEEYNLPVNERSNARLDNIEHELLKLGEGFAAQVGISNP